MQQSVIRTPLFRLAALLLIVACADKATGPTVPAHDPPPPAGKANEAWGFDMRLIFAEGVLDELGPNYYWAIRDAVVRWERIVYWNQEVSHFYDMSKTTRGLTLEDSDTGEEIVIFNQRAYLGSSELVIFVFIDDEITEPPSDEFTTYAYASFWFIDDKQVPVSALFIPHYVLEYMDEGTYEPDAFYSDIVHEIGHILGFNGILESKRLVARNGDDWSYRGKHGVSAFERVTNKSGSIPMIDPGHFDGYDTKWSRSWDVMFQYFAGLHPRKKLISEVSVGVLDDLGYWVNYREADETSLSRREDPRSSSFAGKPIVDVDPGRIRTRCAPPRIGTVVIH